MTVFPSLKPAARAWTPTQYPNAAVVTLSGRSKVVRRGSNAQQSLLRLEFQALTESEMLTIANHYTSQLGSFLAFYLPEQVWSAGSNPGNAWRYAEAPQVEDIAADDQTRYMVSVKLVSVAGELVVSDDEFYTGLHAQAFSWDVALQLDSWGN